MCNCGAGLQYDHHLAICDWPNARKCCERPEAEGGLAHRPCETYASCIPNNATGYCDEFDFYDPKNQFLGFLEDNESCDYFYKVSIISYNSVNMSLSVT